MEIRMESVYRGHATLKEKAHTILVVQPVSYLIPALQSKLIVNIGWIVSTYRHLMVSIIAILEIIQ